MDGGDCTITVDGTLEEQRVQCFQHCWPHVRRRAIAPHATVPTLTAHIFGTLALCHVGALQRSRPHADRAHARTQQLDAMDGRAEGALVPTCGCSDALPLAWSCRVTLCAASSASNAGRPRESRGRPFGGYGMRCMLEFRQRAHPCRVRPHRRTPERLAGASPPGTAAVHTTLHACVDIGLAATQTCAAHARATSRARSHTYNGSRPQVFCTASNKCVERHKMKDNACVRRRTRRGGICRC
jgi:hypothetical protein